MRTTQSFGNDHNKYWNIGENLGNEFEDIIFDTLRNTLTSHLYKDVSLEQTERTNDHGKDIIIKFKCEVLSIFGVAFNKGEKNEAVIYIECKSSNSAKTLRREKFMTSVERGSKTEIDYYVLLTNSKIMAYDYYLVENQLSTKGIQFVLIDQYILANFLRKYAVIQFQNIPIYEENSDGSDEYYVEYQIDKNETDDEIYDIYFVFRNYSKKSQLYTISLVTNVSWDTKEAEDASFSFSIDANCAQSKKVSLRCDYEKDYKTLVFKVENNTTESFLTIKGVNLEECYIPPLTGKRHHEILDSMFNDIAEKKVGSLFCLWGEAGIGKSRIACELRKKLAGGQYDIFDCELNRTNSITIKKINEFLYKKRYFTEKVPEKYEADLYYTVSKCNTIIKKALIFIDDFHNSNAELIEQIKKLHSLSTPVIFVLCGRNDYYAGSSDYYSFIQWTYENLYSQNTVWNVMPLSGKETRSLIQSMIKEIPQDALKTICKLSDNNPLYIVQFVEYLLDEKIARLVNRNCVGIIDPTNFKSHNYLPSGVADIYRKRINHLNKETKEYMKFLYCLSVYGGQLPSYMVEDYFDQEGTIVPFLYSKKFITKKGDTITFYHESLKIYIQNMLVCKDSYKKEIAKYILGLPREVQDWLPMYTIGRLYLWSGNSEKALHVLNPIIEEIQSIKNISNLNIDVLSYEYFDDILQICQDKLEYQEVIEKAIKGSVYMKLHHFVPISAAEECDKYITYIDSSSVLKDNYELKYSLLTQKAHALLNSGMNMKGEFVLKELLAKWLIDGEHFDQNTVFDMLDRLCAIYVKFNCYDIACDYNKLELGVADKSDDLSLSAIAYRTRSKLFYLNNSQECQNSLDKVDLLLTKCPSPRIQLNNNIYRAIAELTYSTGNDYDKIISNLEEYSQLSDEQNLNRADIQGNMVLAAAYLKRGNQQDLIAAQKRIDKAIARSISYGIPSYLWQLYNLKAIIDTRLRKNSNVIKESFENCFEILHKQNLLFIGNGDLCYSNILAISNIAFYFQKHSYQATFNLKMSKITYYSYSADDSSHSKLNSTTLTEAQLVHIYERASKKELLFSAKTSTLLLRDDETGYFIALT